MTIAYLNGDYLPLEEARISPMDRGFLFGDGIYEVIPSYDGKLVGFAMHLDRLHSGLSEVEIELNMSETHWRDVCETLIDRNGGGNLALYIQVSRGADVKRHHAYPKGIEPTVFAYGFEIPPSPVADRESAHTLKIVSNHDKRWARCNIKSVALLGNIMHYQQGNKLGKDEVLLFNDQEEVTEGAASNVFIVKDGTVATPPLDHQVLPGITRQIILSILNAEQALPVEERVVTLEEAQNADEIWFTSSTKEVIAVTELDGKPVGDGSPGPAWQIAQSLFSEQKYNF